MNKEIKKFAEQAGMVMYPTGLGVSENTIWGDRNIEKFAELIVKECIDYCGENLSKTVGGALKIHFGVEE